MQRLLRLANAVLGSQIAASVFEPLVADWQRELAAASSNYERARIVISGSAAFALSCSYCLLTGGVVMPRAAIFRAMTVLFLSTLALLAIQIALNAAALRNNFPLEWRLWSSLPMILPLAIPLAMLPIMMLVRGAGRVTAGGAATLIATGVILTYLAAGWLTPLLRADFRDELYEQIERRVVADEQAGRVFYPGTAARQAKPTTPEQRAAARERWRNDPRYIESMARQTRPRWGRGTILTAALALAMGVLGWGIGALRPAGAMHAGAWWAFAWFALMILDGRFLYPGNGVSQYIGRAPYWVPLAVFATAALAISVASRRRANAREAPQAPQAP